MPPIGKGRKTKTQMIRDRTKVMELYSVGFAADQIVERMKLVTRVDGYVLTVAEVNRHIRDGMESLNGAGELNREAYRQMMLYRLQRRRTQLEDIIEAAGEEYTETVARKRDINGAGRGQARVPVAGYTEVQNRTRKRVAPISAFEQLNAIDKLEMDLLGLQLKPEVPEDMLPENEFVAKERALDYDEAGRIMIDNLAAIGQVPNLVTKPEIVRPTLVEQDNEEIIEGVYRTGD